MSGGQSAVLAPAYEASSVDELGATAAQQQLAELSHDLRTPLTSISLLVKALRDGLVSDSERSKYLARIELETLLLSSLVDELHSLARNRAADRGGIAECVQPQGLIQAAIETMRIQAEVKNIALESELARCLPSIRANSTRLQRVLLNLIDNAIRHTGQGGRVVVRAERTLGGVEIEIEDEGDGIAPEERDRVFDAFYVGDRQDSATRSGLGLAIARATVEAHGGRIWLVDSRRGARVRLSLPAPQYRLARNRDPQLTPELLTI